MKKILYVPFIIIAVILFVLSLGFGLLAFGAYKVADSLEYVVALIIAYALGVYKVKGPS